MREGNTPSHGTRQMLILGLLDSRPFSLALQSYRWVVFLSFMRGFVVHSEPFSAGRGACVLCTLVPEVLVQPCPPFMHARSILFTTMRASQCGQVQTDPYAGWLKDSSRKPALAAVPTRPSQAQLCSWDGPACCGRLASRADGPTQGQAAQHACPFQPHACSSVVSLIHRRPILEQKGYMYNSFQPLIKTFKQRNRHFDLTW